MPEKYSRKTDEYRSAIDNTIKTVAIDKCVI